jgi:hypothetical protein
MSHTPLFKQTIPLFISSSTTDGASNLNALQNEFLITVDPTIVIPSEYRPTIRLLSANIWFTSANVHQTLYNNNVLVINNGGPNITITFPNGLYDVAGINDYIGDTLLNQGLPQNLVNFQGIPATGAVSARLSSNTVSILWSLSTISSLLGWTQLSANSGPGAANTTYVSPNAAAFNSLESMQIHCSIASGSYLGSKGGSDIIATITPNVEPGSLIQYRPLHLIETMLNTRHISRIQFRVTDQTGADIDLSAERYSFVLEVVLTPI